MNSLMVKISRILVTAVLVFGIAAVGAFAGQQAGVFQVGSNTGYRVPNQANALNAIDFANAKPMPLPMSPVAPCMDCGGGASLQSFGTPGVSPGAAIGGTKPATNGLNAIIPASLGLEDEEFVPQEQGTSLHPFTTSRVDLGSPLLQISNHYPFAPSGKLYFTKSGSTYVCSASLIKRGVAVTAAHCVANWGQSQFYSNWQFVPAKYDSSAPYGTWTVYNAWIKTGYYNGSTPCYVNGVVCPNDVAVLEFNTQSGLYPGSFTGGWYGYGWNGWGFNSQSPAKTHVSQLGYPASHDSGNRMQRTDSYAFTDTGMNNNTVWGSRQTGGSSGGPEIVNLGPVATLSGGISSGTYPNRNIVIGVTSWGYTDQAVKQQGASPFTSTNIVSLVNAACADLPSACQ